MDSSEAEFLFDCVLACEQAELGAVEARAEQLVDGLLKGSEVMEDADRLANRRGGPTLPWVSYINCSRLRVRPGPGSTTKRAPSRQFSDLPWDEIWGDTIRERLHFHMMRSGRQ